MQIRPAAVIFMACAFAVLFTGPASAKGRRKTQPIQDEEPAPAPPEESLLTEVEAAHFGGAARGGIRLIPTFGLDFVASYHPNTPDTLGMTAGVEFIRRKGNIDIRAGLSFDDYASVNEEGDAFLKKKGKIEDLEYYRSTLRILSADAALIRATELTPWLNVIYGGGAGVGLVIGELVRADTYAVNPAYPSNRRPCTGRGAPDLKCQSDQRVDQIPPVLPMVNLLAGTRFDITDNLSIRIEGGLRTVSVYGGAGLEYVN